MADAAAGVFVSPGVRSLGYQAQDAAMTLAEGLEEYYRANGGRVVRPEHLPAESAELFRSHDLCHVAFGLDTSLADEAMADVRTLLSCDVGVRRYARYLTTDPAAKALFKQIGVWNSVWITVAVIPRMLRAVFESWRTHEKWPWSPPHDFLDRPIGEVRRQLGIRVI